MMFLPPFSPEHVQRERLVCATGVRRVTASRAHSFFFSRLISLAPVAQPEGRPQPSRGSNHSQLTTVINDAVRLLLFVPCKCVLVLHCLLGEQQDSNVFEIGKTKKQKVLSQVTIWAKWFCAAAVIIVISVPVFENKELPIYKCFSLFFNMIIDMTLCDHCWCCSRLFGLKRGISHLHIVSRLWIVSLCKGFAGSNDPKIYFLKLWFSTWLPHSDGGRLLFLWLGGNLLVSYFSLFSLCHFLSSISVRLWSSFAFTLPLSFPLLR